MRPQPALGVSASTSDEAAHGPGRSQTLGPPREQVVQLEVGGQHVALLAVEDPDAPKPPAKSAAAADGAATSASAAAPGAGNAAAASGTSGMDANGGADGDETDAAAADSSGADGAAAGAAPKPADLWAAAVAASAPKPAVADAGGAGWAAAVAASASNASAVRGAEAAVPQQRSGAPNSVADGPALAPGALGFAGAAAPEVSDAPFLGGDNPASQQ